jgi:hypothetical protein
MEITGTSIWRPWRDGDWRRDGRGSEGHGPSQQ